MSFNLLLSRFCLLFCRHALHGTIVLLSIAALLGCGSNEPFDYVKVQGKVSYDDGTPLPIKQYQLTFESESPAKGTFHPRPGEATVVDGKFNIATSHKRGDGLVPGKHRVAFAYATDASGKSLVPPEYTETSKTPLEIDTANSPFVIKVPRPTESPTAAKSK